MIPDFPYWPLFEFAGQAHPRPASTAIFPGVWDPACLDPESCFCCPVTQRHHPVSSEAGTLYRGTVLRDAMMLSPEALARGPLAIRRGLLAAAIGHLRAALEQALALDAAMAAERCSEWPSLLGTIESTLHLVLPLIELQVGPMAIAGRPELEDPLLAWMRREAARRLADDEATARRAQDRANHEEGDAEHGEES